MSTHPWKDRLANSIAAWRLYRTFTTLDLEALKLKIMVEVEVRIRYINTGFVIPSEDYEEVFVTFLSIPGLADVKQSEVFSTTRKLSGLIAPYFFVYHQDWTLKNLEIQHLATLGGVSEYKLTVQFGQNPAYDPTALR